MQVEASLKNATELFEFFAGEVPQLVVAAGMRHGYKQNRSRCELL
jgi:hypothetical protein